MSILTSGLETTDYGQQGWNAVHTANMQKIDQDLRGPFLATKNLGDDAVSNAAAATAASLTDSTGETPDNTIAQVDAVVGSALTNNTGETPDTTIANVGTAVTGVDGTGSNAASKADIDSRLTDINKNCSDLADQLNTHRTDVNNRLDLVNKNFSDQADEINKLIADNASLRTQLNALLAALRKTGGCGVLNG